MPIESIVLSHDHRGVSALRPYLPADFCENAATFIAGRLGTVLVATGFYIPSGGAPETDGPPGAIALGTALAKLGARVIYVSDVHTTPLLRGLLGPAADVVEFPMADHETSRRHATDLLGRFSPSLTVAVERCGLTADNVYRNMVGADVSGYHAKIDYLFREHAWSVGVGDGGNEIGMGNLAAAIPVAMPHVVHPSATTTTRLVIASVSNWGAWGIVAALSRLRRVNLLPTVAEARDLLERSVALGAVDGTTGRRIPSVDGFAADENDTVLAEMHAWIARRGIDATAA